MPGLYVIRNIIRKHEKGKRFLIQEILVGASWDSRHLRGKRLSFICRRFQTDGYFWLCRRRRERLGTDKLSLFFHDRRRSSAVRFLG